MCNMKRIGFLLAALLAAGVYGASVTSDDAANAVRGWSRVCEALDGVYGGEVSAVHEYSGKEGVGKFYVVEFADGGFAVTSGDTELTPIIAYSKEGTWEATDENPLYTMLTLDTAAMTAGLSERSSDINATASVSDIDSEGSSSAVKSSGGRLLAAAGEPQAAATASSAKAAKWAALIAKGTSSGRILLTASRQSSVADVRVPVLLTTKWGQSELSGTTKCYNLYTPLNRPCGCVATAGAQIMYYHKWPTNAVSAIKNYYGSVTGIGGWDMTGYDASEEDSKAGTRTPWSPPFGGPYLWDTMGTTRVENRRAIAQLTRDVGMSCFMNYGASASGAPYGTLAYRFVEQFGYANARLKISPDSTDWRRAILASLDAKLPVGVGIPAHAVVADGYGYSDGTLYIHFNLGWKGTSDAWYNPPDLTEANSKFSSIDLVIYNVYSPQTCETAGRSIMSGRILDASMNPAAGLAVAAVNKTSGARYSATTDERGIYAFFVPEGRYTVSATLGGSTVETSATAATCVSGEMNDAGGYNSSKKGTVGNVYGVDMSFGDKVAAPVFSVSDGTTFRSRRFKVALSCTTAGARIYYTLDGSEPTTSSARYVGEIALSDTTTVKARAYLDGFASSDVATATFTRLEISDGSKEDARRKWIYETEETTCATGAWRPEADYVDGAVPIDGQMEFVAAREPARQDVSVEMEISFADGFYGDVDIEEAKCAIQIGTNGCFRLFTRVDGKPQWVDVEGLTPQEGATYSVKFLTGADRTYRVVVRNVAGPNRGVVLSREGRTSFPFAHDDGGRVQAVGFEGGGEVSHIFGRDGYLGTTIFLK